MTDELRISARKIVVEVLEVDPAELTDQGEFIEEYGADSLILIELIARFERDLGVKIPAEEAVEIDTLADAYAAIDRHAPAEVTSA